MQLSSRQPLGSNNLNPHIAHPCLYADLIFKTDLRTSYRPLINRESDFQQSLAGEIIVRHDFIQNFMRSFSAFFVDQGLLRGFYLSKIYQKNRLNAS